MNGNSTGNKETRLSKSASRRSEPSTLKLIVDNGTIKDELILSFLNYLLIVFLSIQDGL